MKGTLLCVAGFIVGLTFYFKFIAQDSQSIHTFSQRFSYIRVSPTYSPDPISMEKIFADDHDWTATLSAQRKITVLATGDVMLGRHVNIITTKSNNFLWPFEKVKDELFSADVTYINLENPLITDCPFADSGFIFCGDLRHISGLLSAGVDVVSLANNHAGNYGYEGLVESAKELQKNNILPVGQKEIGYLKVKDKTIAFLGYNDIGHDQQGISWAYEDALVKDIAEAKKNADIVIPMFHWGNEYVLYPTERQIHLAHISIDAGADLVLGNHPHWFQILEIYKGKVINYSHGNFIFDQEWSLKTKQGIVGKYIFYDTTLVDVELLPVLIEDYGQPHFLHGKEKSNILQELKDASM